MEYQSRKTACLTWILLLVLPISGIFAAVDCYIQPWGAPPYQTPDIWADNNGNGAQECGEPSLGIVNQLFARIHNVGSTTATNVQVRFYYAPFGMGYPHTHFKLISTLTIPTLNGGSDMPVQTGWDLSNLNEDNGGLWPYPISSFDHFCVRVEIECAGDVNTANNDAQNNFTAVTCSDCGFNFLIVNPKKALVNASLSITGLPKGWNLGIDIPGAKNIQEFNLEPNEVKMAQLTLYHPEEKITVTQDIDVGLNVDGENIGGITFRPVSITNQTEKRHFSLSYHMGHAVPTKPYSKIYQADISRVIDLDYYLYKNIYFVWFFGYHSMMARIPTDIDTHWWSISANLKPELPVSSNINLYMNFGPGYYIPQSGSNETGFNAGLGWNYRLAQDCRLEFGCDYHRISGKTDAEFLVIYMGVVFRYQKLGRYP